jgi:hypothetical protein
MSTAHTATALTGVGVVLAGAVYSTQHAFSAVSSSDPVFAGLQTLSNDLLTAAPFALLLLVGALFVQATGGLR